MKNVREKLQDAILSMTRDELAVFAALLQIRCHDLGADEIQPIPPDGMSKADCKRLVKAIRAKDAGVFGETRMNRERVISHIRSVWLPQLGCHD